MNNKKLIILLTITNSVHARQKPIERIRNLIVANSMMAKSIRVQDLNVEGVISFGRQAGNIVNGPINSLNNEIVVFNGTSGNSVAGSGFLMPTADAAPGQILATNGAGQLFFTTPAGGGNVSASALTFTTDNAIIRVDLPSGAHNIQESGVVIDDSNNITGVNELTANLITATTSFQGPLIGDVVASAGTATNPSIAINNTAGVNLPGVFSSAPDTLSFATSGVEQVNIDSSGILNALQGLTVVGNTDINNNQAGPFTVNINTGTSQGDTNIGNTTGSTNITQFNSCWSSSEF